MRDIFVGLTLAVNKSRTYEDFRSVKSKYISESATYLFDTAESIEEFSPLAFQIDKDDKIRVEITEYAAKIFKKIRSFENLNEDDLME